ncbi:unnamed protein product [Mytilus coruscus]|uniref:Uncharacterized protein n=1 Tax=Mytilus coruscus TaxID=42192 RepID=A0A6J8C9W7_MYTCO|nr:unnamed protein product [Mytilus coruscus]
MTDCTQTVYKTQLQVTSEHDRLLHKQYKTHNYKLLQNMTDCTQAVNGWTALMLAASEGHLEICRLLIDTGCKIDITTIDGETALMLAAWRGHLEICRLLIDTGCKIDTTTDRGLTALMFAASEGHLEICKLLIDTGCKIDTTSRNGYTALHYAAQIGHLQTTRCLVEQGGASPLVTTHKDETPYDLAAERQYKEVMEYLQKMSDPILIKLRQLNRNDFQDLVSLGTFASYENRVYLAGPCNIGKSSLASILIGEEIPKTWFSTDGLIIHFGRNGIDLQQRKMIPLKKGMYYMFYVVAFSTRFFIDI